MTIIEGNHGARIEARNKSLVFGFVLYNLIMKDYIELRNGGYYIAGKRVSLDSLVYAFRRGESPESIRQSNTLTV